MRRRTVRGLIAAVLLLVVAACAPGSERPAAPAAALDEEVLLVALGGGATAGTGLDEPLLDAWPQVAFRALPRSTVLTNLASDGLTAAAALATSVPEAAGLAPRLAAVWFGPEELAAGVPAEAFAADLRAVVDALEAAGAAVAVVTVPQLAPDEPPDDLQAAYRRAARQVAEATGSALVDLDALGRPLPRPLVTRREGRATLNARGHAALGERVAAALGAAPDPATPTG
jgi:hypothetical protein